MTGFRRMWAAAALGAALLTGSAEVQRSAEDSRAGVRVSRELPVVWAVAKDSLLIEHTPPSGASTDGISTSRAVSRPLTSSLGSWSDAARALFCRRFNELGEVIASTFARARNEQLRGAA
jgi:hypothetical protein